MSEHPQLDMAQVEREERRIIEETEKAGGTVHEFNPDASPKEKAASAGEVGTHVQSIPFLSSH